LSRFVLSKGDHRVEVFDPRVDPLALGARYVHGGYIARWTWGDRCLTGRPKAEWNPYEGEGLPETFEYGLGWSAAEEGQEFLRIGAGRLRRTGRNWPQAGGQLVSPVHWALEDSASDSLRVTCKDSVRIGHDVYGYELERQVLVHPDGVESRTRLCIACPWSHPVFWFAHPFFRHADGSGTRIQVPPGACCSEGLARGADGRVGTEMSGGFGTVTGLWGDRNAIAVNLDARQGGGQVWIELSRPLDKLVVFSTPLVFSVEPYLARAWHDKEEAEWSLRYRVVSPTSAGC